MWIPDAVRLAPALVATLACAAPLATPLAAQGTASATAAAAAHSLDAATRERVLDSLLAVLDREYVFPAVAKRVRASIEARRRRGEYARMVDGAAFAELLTRHLREITHDKHLGVDFHAAPLPLMPARAPDSAWMRRARRHAERRNYGFPRVEILPGNVGYVKIGAFFRPDDGGADAAQAAMAFVANTDALVFDLRGNGGGSPAMVAFVLGHLFEQPVHLNDIVQRGDSAVRQWWTAAVPGRKYLGRPVYVLVDSATISAGEEFAYDVQTQRRGTIVGEVTAGAANPGGTVRLDERFTVFVPHAYARNAVTGDNWEGKGVAPDVAAPGASALDMAHADALTKLLAAGTALDAERRSELAAALREVRARLGSE